MEIVTARQNFQDSIVYEITVWGTNWGTLYTEASKREVIYNVDSPAGPLYSSGFCSNCDSILYRYSCNNNTITVNESCANGSGSYTQTFQNGLGKTIQNSYCAVNGGYDLSYSVNLIYYHKTNESPNGTFVQLPTGISSLTLNDFQATLNPSPTEISSVLKVSAIFNSPMYFKLFDVLGRPILEKEIEVNSTLLDLQTQQRGTYFWIVESGEAVLHRGKLILQ